MTTFSPHTRPVSEASKHPRLLSFYAVVGCGIACVFFFFYTFVNEKSASQSSVKSNTEIIPNRRKQAIKEPFFSTKNGLSKGGSGWYITDRSFFFWNSMSKQIQFTRNRCNARSHSSRQKAERKKSFLELEYCLTL